MDAGQIRPAATIYRWDLDKTYLETKFDTVRDLLRTALEVPSTKRSVPGAPALLRELNSTSPAGIHFLSGSPEQMRRALEAKLQIDGVAWDSFTLKPSLRNLVRGRFRFLRDQLGYKYGSLLQSRKRMSRELDEVMFGDDAEVDAFVYSLYSDTCRGVVNMTTLAWIFEQGGLYEDDAAVLLQHASQVAPRDCVRRIFIHLDRVSDPGAFAMYGSRICPVYNYFQCAVVLAEMGALPALSALRVGGAVASASAFRGDSLTASFMDMVHRGFAGSSVAGAFVQAWQSAGVENEYAAFSALTDFVDTLERRMDLIPATPVRELIEVDYAEVFKREKARVSAAKLRAIWKRR